MIDTVLFDMGGTLEDIWVDDESRHSSIQGVLDILRAHGIDLNMDFETAAQSINAGWERYGAYPPAAGAEAGGDLGQLRFDGFRPE